MVAAPNTPSLHWTGRTEQINELARCGPTIYAVGSFTKIDQGGVTYDRRHAFSFSATTGAMTSWNPAPNGVVNAIALNATCSRAYLGGSFFAVGAATAHNFAAVDTARGILIGQFRHEAGNVVEAIVLGAGRIIVGGSFRHINGGTHPYLASLRTSDGADDGYVHVAISGTYTYTDDNGAQARSGPPRIAQLVLGPYGGRLILLGTFTSVGTQSRRQIAVLRLGSYVSVDRWFSPEFAANCAVGAPFYVRDAAWSPDGHYIFVADTGYKPATGAGFRTWQPRAGLCDAVAKFPAGSDSNTRHVWVNYTGCDSLYAVAADATTVYVAGHERWLNNRAGCDTAGAGALARPGVGAVSAATGLATAWNPTRSRGLGAHDLLLTTRPTGLWIASDNLDNLAVTCAHSRHPGLCFLPAG